MQELNSGHGRHLRHLTPGADVSSVDRLDEVPVEKAERTAQQSATPAQPGEMEKPADLLQVLNLVAAVGLEPTTYGL